MKDNETLGFLLKVIYLKDGEKGFWKFWSRDLVQTT